MVSQTKVNEDINQALNNQQSMIKNLERIVGNIARMLNERPLGELPPNTQVNPRGEDAKTIHINVVTTPEKEGK